MKLRTTALLIVTHIFVGLSGFVAGIYVLPILTAPEAPTKQEVAKASLGEVYRTQFHIDLKGSDALHWGDGIVSIGRSFITFRGELAPGPDYKLYLSSEFVETEADFERLKHTMVAVGDVNTFNNFIVELSPDIEPSNYTTVIVWCESFGEFITAGKYQ